MIFIGTPDCCIRLLINALELELAQYGARCPVLRKQVMDHGL